MWGELVETLLDQFFSLELRESKAEEFMNLEQGKMSVKEYTMKFNQLSRYSSDMAGNMRAHMRMFASDLLDDLVLECKEKILNRNMEFSRLFIRMQ